MSAQVPERLRRLVSRLDALSRLPKLPGKLEDELRKLAREASGIAADASVEAGEAPDFDDDDDFNYEVNQ